MNTEKVAAAIQSSVANPKPPRDYIHFVVPLAPALSIEEEKKVVVTEQVACEVNKTAGMSVRILGREEKIDAIAISLKSDAPIDDLLIRKTLNHLLSVIRITHDSSKETIHIGDTPLVIRAYSNNELPVLSMPPNFSVDHGIADRDILQEVFNMSDTKYRGTVNLIAEAQLPSLPDHYKILSLVRAIELMTPKGQEIGDILDKYEAQFKETKMSGKKFRNALPQIRNLCAHGPSNKNAEPMVAAVCAEMPYITNLILLLRKITSDMFESSFGIRMYVDLEARPPIYNQATDL